MPNIDIYKKGLEVLNIAKNNIQSNKIFADYRDSVYSVFFENNSIRREFVDIFPPEKIGKMNRFLVFLKSINATIGNDTIMSVYGTMEKQQVLTEIAELEGIILKNVTCTRCLKIDIMKPLHRRWQTCQDMVNLVNKRLGTA